MDAPMETRNMWRSRHLSDIPTTIAYFISLLVGVGLWIGIMFVTGEHEAWDTGIYFIYAWPIMALISGALGFFMPERPWRWGAVMLASQALLAIIVSRSANLLPFGLVVFFVLSLPCILLAYGGAAIRRKLRMVRSD